MYLWQNDKNMILSTEHGSYSQEWLTPDIREKVMTERLQHRKYGIFMSMYYCNQKDIRSKQGYIWNDHSLNIYLTLFPHLDS